LTTDGTVPLTLVFRNAKGEQTRQEIKLPVSRAAPAASGHGRAMH